MPASEPLAQPHKLRLSLRARGLLVLAAIATYVSVVVFVLNGERQRLLESALALERLHVQQAAAGKTMQAIHHSLMRLQDVLEGGEIGAAAVEDVALDADLVHAGLQSLQPDFAQFRGDIDRLVNSVSMITKQPSRGGIVVLREQERELDARLSRLDRELRDERAELWDGYYRVYDRMTLLGVTTNLVGVVVFGAVITIFFTRLAWDIRKLEERATAVVAGYRGPPLPVTRTDELGELMRATNGAQSVLREREQKLEIAREQHFHREKMAAVGSLAAAVAHEINNPIAAIAGIAQGMARVTVGGEGSERDALRDGPRLILAQTERISRISRQIAEFTRPTVAHAELINLNALVRNTCTFMGYDKRLRDVELVLELDHELPAIVAVADHVTQVLMNLLINAADALVGIERKGTIRVQTRPAGSDVVLTVTDNGRGMNATTVARAFDESFSTKLPGQGRGLGLFLCKTLVERDGGQISIASTPDAGTTVSLSLPVDPIFA